MAITLIDCEGFETKDFNGLVNVDSTTLDTTPAPWNPWKEVVTALVPNIGIGLPTPTGGDIRGLAVSPGTDWITQGLYFMWSDFGSATSEAFFFSATKATDYWQLSYVRNGNVAALRLRDQAGAIIATTGDILEEDRWHRIEIKWKISSTSAVRVWVDGWLEIDEASENLDSGATSVFTYITNESSQADAVNLYIDSYYLITDDGANIDTNETWLGAWTVNAHFISGVTTAAGNFGDALDSGSWDDMEESPGNDANFGRYTITFVGDESGGVTCDNFHTGGPYSESSGYKVDGVVVGTKWMWRWKAPRQSKLDPNPARWFGKYGQQVVGSSSTDNTSETTHFVGNGSWHTYRLCQWYTESEVPTKDEYYQMGFGGEYISGFISWNIDSAEMWAITLQQEPRFLITDGRVMIV